jgi:hypothetical protein
MEQRHGAAARRRRRGRFRQQLHHSGEAALRQWPHKDQRFNLREHDWAALKRLVDGGQEERSLAVDAGWKPALLSDAELADLIGTRPELLEVLLTAPNIGQFTEPSLEALDRLGARIGQLRRDQLEVIFRRLEAASDSGIGEFSRLLRDLELEQVATLAALVRDKLRTIDLLEQVTSDPARTERAAHEIFDRNPWLLGRGFEIVQSDRMLATYLGERAKVDPNTRRRPDLIIRRIPHTRDVLLVELKAPGVALAAAHIGQVLEYRGLIEHHQPNAGTIHCFVLGYSKGTGFTTSRDVAMTTFSELVNQLRDEYAEYASVLAASQSEIADLPYESEGGG